MPQPRDQYVSPVLTQVSVRYSNKQFVNELVSPIVEVDKETGIYFTYDKTNLRAPITVRTGMAEANEIDYAVTQTPYGPLLEHSLKKGITYRELDQYNDPLNPRIDATETVTEMLMVEKEKALAAAMGNTAILTQNSTLSGTGQWSDPASNPITAIQAAIDVMAKGGLARPNKAVMGREVWTQLKNHAAVVDRVKYGQTHGIGAAQISTQGFADLFDLDEVIISNAVENTAKEGQTASNSFIWGKNFQLFYAAPGGSSLRDVTAFKTLTLKGARRVFNYQADEPGIGEWVKVMDNYQQMLVAAEAAYLFKNAVA